MRKKIIHKIYGKSHLRNSGAGENCNKIRRKLLAAYGSGEMNMERAPPISMTDDSKVHTSILRILHSTRGTGEDYSVATVKEESMKSVISIWELGSALEDGMKMGDSSMGYKPDITNEKSTESIPSRGDKTICKSRARRKLPDVDEPSPTKKSRVVDPEGNIRVTRSMTKLPSRGYASNGENGKHTPRNCRKKKRQY